MFNDYLEEKIEERRFQISLHGGTVEGEEVENGKSNMAFRSPEEYEDMSMEERKKLTQKMVQHWSGTLNIDNGGSILSKGG